MSGVADEANLSRGTVYRYFVNREQLLDAMAEYVREQVQYGIVSSAAGEGGTRDKLRRIFAGSMDDETRVAIRRLRELQPAFTLSFLTAHMPDFRAVFTSVLRDDFEGRDMPLSLDEFVEFLTRISVTETLLDDQPGNVERLVLTLWDAIQPPAKVRRASTPKTATAVKAVRSA
ncbi:MAG: putative transcriptional regulator, family [Ilumatobacteraceae bacterium]|nr:putative transcriptional regulator, family [Ilumatobacteraceae bacterium]